MVAQIGALELARERLERQQQMPVGAHAGQALLRLPVQRLRQVRPVVHQYAHGHATRDRLFHRDEEVLGRGVGLEDVELDVHVALRAANGLCHRPDALVVVRDEARAVISRQRQGAELPVHVDDRLEPFRRVRQQGAELKRVVRRVQEAVDLALHLAALLRQARISDQQEQQHAGHRQEEDQQEPRHRRGRPAPRRHEHDRCDPNRHIDDEDEGGPGRGPCQPLQHSTSLRTSLEESVARCRKTASRALFGFDLRVGPALGAVELQDVAEDPEEQDRDDEGRQNRPGSRHPVIVHASILPPRVPDQLGVDQRPRIRGRACRISRETGPQAQFASRRLWTPHPGTCRAASIGA